MSGAIKAFPRYFIVVGFVLLFLPRYVPSDAHVMWTALAWITYLVTPYVLWKLFDRWDRVVENFFNREKQR